LKIENGEEAKQEEQEQDISHVPVMPMATGLDEGDNLDEFAADGQAPLVQDKNAAYRMEKAFKKKMRPLLKHMNNKQSSHLRELTIKYYGKIIGNVAWNLLLLLYQEGYKSDRVIKGGSSLGPARSGQGKDVQKASGDDKSNSIDYGRETKNLIKKMATKSRNQSTEPS
jgi:hypothetical protein